MGRGTSGAGSSAGGGAKAASNVPVDPKNLTEAEAEALRQQYESGFDADTQKSIDKYISATAIDNDGHSMSQTMNFLISRGENLDTLTAAEANAKYGLGISEQNMKAMRKANTNIDNAMHDLGADVNLERGAHSGQFDKMFGISNYENMSNAQLKQALIGKAFQNTAVWSTSYNTAKNPFLSSSSNVSGGREVVYRIKAGKKTQVVFGAKNQAEVILGKGTNFKITDAGFTGKIAHPKSGGTKKQIYIDIETI